MPKHLKVIRLILRIRRIPEIPEYLLILNVTVTSSRWTCFFFLIDLHSFKTLTLDFLTLHEAPQQGSHLWF